MDDKPTAKEILTKLKQGNRHFARALEQGKPILTKHKKITNQNPSAIVLGCSDSRVPAEIIFNKGLGELFVIRVAGNIVTPSQMGSIEYATMQFECPLIIVLGHSNCGAVHATLDNLDTGVELTEGITSIVKHIRPAIQPLFKAPLKDNPQDLLQAAIHANIRASINHLCDGSPLLGNLIKKNKLSIIGAHYNLDSGIVEFFEDA